METTGEQAKEPTWKARGIMSDSFFYGMTIIGFIVVAYLIKNF
jgi:hypothetical protein